MENKHIHIISFNVPYPPNYGGVIDVYYKLKALHELGIKIHLHCFQYGRKESTELNEICEEVRYYPREKFWKGFLDDRPFIVQSRNAKALKNALLENSYPVLFEGLHCCYFLPDPQLQSRLKIVRMHNDEAAYYLKLAQQEKKFFSRIYFYLEYKRLMKYEQVLQFASHIFCISQTETAHYQSKFSTTNYLAPFHGNELVSSKTGNGEFALYHGNLEVSENEEAVLFLADGVFNDLNLKLIIAGNNPSAQIKRTISKYTNIQLIENPSSDQLNELMKDAHLHVLPTFTPTGIKLKLLNALFRGRFCLVNKSMVAGTGLEKYCIVADDATAFKRQIQQIFLKSFTEEDKTFRKQIEKEFSDRREAEKIINLL